MFIKVLRTQFYAAGVIVSLGVAFVALLSRPILAMYGKQFSDGSLVLVLVMVSCIPMQLASVAGVVNRCIGNIWWSVLLNAVWAVVLIISTYSLIDQGALGLAWAILVSYSFHLLFTTIYLLWAFKTSPNLAVVQ